MDLDCKLKNWENFCQHQLGDWYGTWRFYSGNGEFLKSFRCIRSFRSSNDEQVQHQNHYFYEDGQEKTETFGPYIKPEMRGTYLKNSFSWGVKHLRDNFFFETGFSHENKRASLVAIYENRVLRQVIAIVENKDEFKESLPLEMPSKLEGKSQSITTDLVISEEKRQVWHPLSDNLTLSFQGNLFLTCPQELTSDSFNLTVDWLAMPSLLYRGIRSFDASQFKEFTLQTFTTF
ncbi:DUF3598 family protein [Crocosphaera subtropica]|nr:DUF3598 family protein [Crocosphaera subtropica]